ncbi:MAG: molybdenum cofactor biosynthesis protein B [Pseudomonadota bacterium]|nr:molybdenum cofactor biosynthesis protein B [Pseudomonadota bacterium]
MNAQTPQPTPGSASRIDESLPFKPVRIAVLSISDTRDAETDTSGNVLAERIAGAGHILAVRTIVPDDVDAIRSRVRAWISTDQCDVVITTGGTGLTGRDVTPEALEPMFDKRLDGFSVIFHQLSYQSVGLSTLQSRATAGLISGVFVFCLPGSNGAVKDGWSVIGPQLDSRHRPCNLVELMPRLMER